jgi:malonyl-CoA O-methyltransferase
MPPEPPERERGQRRPVDAAALAHHHARLSRQEPPPWLHGEVARRMADRLPAIRLQPQRVLDWQAHLGVSRALLTQQYPKAEVVPVEASAERLRAPRVPWWAAVLGARTPQPIAPAALGESSAQLLWSNMALHFEPEPKALFRHWQRLIAVDGFLMFSTLGPGTLAELPALYATAGWGPPLAPLVDMHDLGDMLVASGFADPVMDQETITLTWPDATACLAELRSLGGNAAPGRHAGLRTPRWRSLLERALAERADAGGRIALTFEVVYGHAFRAAPRARMAEETHVPLADLRAMVRSRGKPTR